MKRGGPLKRNTPLRAKTPLKSNALLKRTPMKRTVKKDPPELAKSKAIVKERCGGRCEARISNVCTGAYEHAHHIQLRSRGGGHEPEGLLGCCASCHRAIHASPEWATEHGFMRSGHVFFGDDLTVRAPTETDDTE